MLRTCLGVSNRIDHAFVPGVSAAQQQFLKDVAHAKLKHKAVAYLTAYMVVSTTDYATAFSPNSERLALRVNRWVLGSSPIRGASNCSTN
jgi:hypothetical protein